MPGILDTQKLAACGLYTASDVEVHELPSLTTATIDRESHDISVNLGCQDPDLRPKLS
jgi:hypothetical protein